MTKRLPAGGWKRGFAMKARAAASSGQRPPLRAHWYQTKSASAAQRTKCRASSPRATRRATRVPRRTEPADEPLETAEEDTVDHHRALALALGVHERDVETLRQVEVDLDGRALPLAADRVEDLDVDLRRVEDAAAFVNLVRDLADAECLLQRALRLVPELVGAEAALRPRREIDARIGVAEGAEELHGEVEDLADLLLGLRPRAEDVRVVLREAADAQHPVQGAAALVAVHRAQLADAQGQLAVAVDPRLVDLDMAGAVHRLDPEPLRALVQQQRPVHVLAIFLEVPGALVDLLVRDMRRVHERVPVLAVD